MEARNTIFGEPAADGRQPDWNQAETVRSYRSALPSEPAARTM